MVTEVIDYYKNNGSPVYMCMFDVSKAFDRVNLLTLFKTLYSREGALFLRSKSFLLFT